MQRYEDVACIYSDQKSPGQSGMFIILKTRKNLVEGVGVEIILKERGVIVFLSETTKKFR